LHGIFVLIYKNKSILPCLLIEGKKCVTNKIMSMALRKINSTNAINETFLQEKCILNKVLKIVGKRWVSEILLLVEKDILRFSEIKESLDGVSDNVLSQSLNELVNSGLLQKKIFQQVPLKVEYSLSKRGKSLVHQLHQLCQWGKQNVELT
jgi:DNA-binding HxlR family transcriptional regulator